MDIERESLVENISHEAGRAVNFNSRRCFHGIQQLIGTGVRDPVKDGWTCGYSDG